jgi:predicted HTH transcriptional regulator
MSAVPPPLPPVPPSSPSGDLAPLGWMRTAELDLPALSGLARRLLPELPDELGPEDAGLACGLLVRSGQATVPTATCGLLLGRHPQLLAPNWGVSAVRVRGSSLSDPLQAREDLEGNVAQLLQRVLDFVQRHSHSMDHTLVEYPEEAVREVVLNALLHRDLRAAGRVAVRLFNDRLEVWSPGGLPSPLADPEDLTLKGGFSSPRNVMLAATARRLGLGEQLGRGLVIARCAVARATKQPVELTVSPADVLVSLPSALVADLAPN